MKRVIIPFIVIFLAVVSFFLSACDNTQIQSSNMENHLHANLENNYACPMHKEIIGKQGDKCSKCGMDLEMARKDISENPKVKITSTPQIIEVRKPVQLSFVINENGKNAKLDVVHEKKIHLLVVDEALTWFDHIHPEELQDGSYRVTETFPHSGKYILFADFKARGKSNTVIKKEIEVAGDETTTPDTVTSKWISKVDGYTITLINGNDFKTNRPQHFGLTIKKDGKSISANYIQQYLGAVAHVVVISKKDKDLLHVHPTPNEKIPIHGETRFEKAGVYRMWVQFQIDGKVQTADFTINVEEGKEVIESELHHHI